MATFASFPAAGAANYEYNTRLSHTTNITGCQELDNEVENARCGQTTLLEKISLLRQDTYGVKTSATDPQANFLLDSLTAGTRLTLSLNDTGDKIRVSALHPDDFTQLTEPPAMSGALLFYPNDIVTLTIVNYNPNQNYYATSSHGSPIHSAGTITMTMPQSAAYPFEDVWIKVSTTRTGYNSSEGIHNCLLFEGEEIVTDDAISYVPDDYIFNQGIYFNEIIATLDNSYLFTDSETQASNETDFSSGYLDFYIQNKESITIGAGSTITLLELTTNSVKLKDNDEICLNLGSTSTNIVKRVITSVTLTNTATTTSLSISRDKNYLQISLGTGSWNAADVGKYIHHKERGIARIISVDTGDAFCYEEEDFILNEYSTSVNILFTSIAAGDWYLSPLDYTCGLTTAIDIVPTKVYKIDNKAIYGHDVELKPILFQEQGLFHITSSATQISFGALNDNPLYCDEIIAYTQSGTTKALDTNNLLRERKKYSYTNPTKTKDSLGTITGTLFFTTPNVNNFDTITLVPSSSPENDFTTDHVGQIIEITGVGSKSGRMLCVKYIDTTHMVVYYIEEVSTGAAISSNDWEIVKYTVTIPTTTDTLIASALPADLYNFDSIYTIQNNSFFLGYAPVKDLVTTGETFIGEEINQEVEVTTTSGTYNNLTDADYNTVLLIRPYESQHATLLNKYNILYDTTSTITIGGTGTNITVTDTTAPFGPTSILFDDSQSTYLKYITNNFDKYFSYYDKDFTIDFWFKINDLAGAAAGRALFNISGNTNNSFAILHSDTSLQVNYRKLGYNSILTEIDINFIDATWMHLAFVKKREKAFLYINGFKIKEFSGITTEINYVDVNSGVYIGCLGNGGTPANFFDGWMTEIRYSNCARWNDEFVPTTYFNKTYAYNLNYNIRTNKIYKAYKKNTNITISNFNNGTITTTDAEDGFDIVTYSGTGAVQSISGLNFQPDLVIIRERDAVGGYSHWFTSLQTAGRYFTDNDSTEIISGTSLTSFESDGFALGSFAGTNNNLDNYVAWCWKAEQNGSDASHNGEKFNANLGISMINYTGVGAGEQKIKHSLGQIPKFAMIVRLSSSLPIAYSHAEENMFQYTSRRRWGATAAEYDDVSPISAADKDYVYIGEVGSTIFKTIGDIFLIFLFAEIDGFSKFGSYIGNGLAAGPSIHCGFEPYFFLTHSPINDPLVIDQGRGAGNSLLIGTNSNAAEDTSSYSVEFKDSGLKLLATGNPFNGTSHYAFIAFAQQKPAYDTLRLYSESCAYPINTRSVATGIKLRKNEKAVSLTLNLNKKGN